MHLFLSDVGKAAKRKAGNMQKESRHATLGLEVCTALAAVASGYRKILYVIAKPQCVFFQFDSKFREPA